MATATTAKKPRANKNDKKSQPKIYTFEWKGLNPEESPDDLQINHQIRVEAHLVA